MRKKISVSSAVFFLCCLAVSLIAQQNVPATNEFIVSGAVKAEKVISLADLKKLKTHELGDVAILNHLGAKKSVETKVKGVLLKEALASLEFDVTSPKYLSEFYFAAKATDGYTVIFSWNEIFNSILGDKIFVVLERDGKTLEQMDDRILLLSTGDLNTGRRHVKGLARIEVGRVKGTQN